MLTGKRRKRNRRWLQMAARGGSLLLAVVLPSELERDAGKGLTDVGKGCCRRKEDQTITLGDRRRQQTSALGSSVKILLGDGAVDARTGAGKYLAATGSWREWLRSSEKGEGVRRVGLPNGVSRRRRREAGALFKTPDP